MARSENTAVNELITQLAGGQTSTPSARMTAAVPPTGPTGGVELPPRVHSLGTQPSPPVGPLPAQFEPDPMHTTRPVTMPVAAPFEVRSPGLPTSYPVISRSMMGPPAPVATSSASGAAPTAGYREAATASPSTIPAWSGASQPQPQPTDRRNHEQFVGTVKIRQSDLRVVVNKLVLPMVLLVIAGIAIGGYVVFSGATIKPSNQAVAESGVAPRPVMAAPVAQVGSTTRAAPAQEAAAGAVPAANPEPAVAEPAVAEPAVPEPAPVPPEPAPAGNLAAPIASVPAANVASAPAANVASAAAAARSSEPAAPVEPVARASALVEVRIDSTPSGATVTLVDRGKSQYVGNTPVNATVDASREYDLVFTSPSKATKVEHFNAKLTRHVAVTLGARAIAAKAAESAPRHVEKAPADAAPALQVKKSAKAAAEPVLGEGTLMISSKPPCEIIIDGTPTGLTTPQRSIPLSTGPHKITLVNSEKDIQKTVNVQITANATEKVIEDLMP